MFNSLASISGSPVWSRPTLFVSKGFVARSFSSRLLCWSPVKSRTSTSFCSRVGKWFSSKPNVPPSTSRVRFHPTGFKASAEKSERIFTSEEAKRSGLSILLSTLGGLGVITILSGPHTFLQEHAKAVFQHHTLGLPTPVTVKMATIISEAAADCFPTTKSTESLAPYVCYGEEAKSFFGKNRPLMLGYPYYFAYETEDQVDVSNMVMAGKYKMPQVTDENAELIEQMRRSLCLSEDARRFLVARELIRGERKRYRIYTFMALGSVLAAAMACNMAHQALRLSKKNRSVRWSIYSAIVCALTGTFFLLKDRLQLIDERSLDTAVCSLGEPYARGGVEFYTKMLQRHLAQRHLMPDNKGTKLYNLKGDIYSGIILTGPTPVTQRKKSCEEQLQLFADAKRS